MDESFKTRKVPNHTLGRKFFARRNRHTPGLGELWGKIFLFCKA